MLEDFIYELERIFNKPVEDFARAANILESYNFNVENALKAV